MHDLAFLSATPVTTFSNAASNCIGKPSPTDVLRCTRRIPAAAMPVAASCAKREVKSSGALSAMRPIAIAAISALLMTGVITPSAPSAHAEIISVPECLKGEGPGCEANAAENGIIERLLEKSRVNKDKNDREMIEKYWKQGYGDYFSFDNKKLVHGDDGKWSLQDADDVVSRLGRQFAESVKNRAKK